MKSRIATPLLAMLALLSISLSGCLEDSCNMTYTHAVYEPVYMPVDEFRSAVEVTAPRDVVDPGKIYTKDAILLVNELGEGVHVFDNKNPQNPQPLAFINVPGNYDLSMNCDKLYLDSSTDLLVFDMADPTNPQLLSRTQNVFPYLAEYNGYVADPNQGMVVKWKQEIREDAYDCQVGVPALWEQNQIDPNDFAQLGGNNTRTVNPAVPGKSGSMSRFTVLNDYLYVVTPTELMVFDASNCSQPVTMGKQDLTAFNFGAAEMITSLNDLLLIGGNSGMAIYDAGTPTAPQFLSVFEHVRACDPVTAEGDFAYVTLRNAQDIPCGPAWTNQLDVISIASPRSPRLMASFTMYNPHGLGIDNGLLFIADGTDGLKIFDASNPVEVGRKQIAHFPAMDGYDVIAIDGLLIFTGDDGIAQYDYSDPQNIELLSTIPVVMQ